MRVDEAPATFRPAAREDAGFLAWAVQEAGRSHVARGFWDLLIPEEKPRLAFLETMLLAEKPSWWHWSAFLVAEADGRPVATLSGFPASDAAMATPEDAIVGAAAACGWSAEERSAAFVRGAPFLTCVVAHPEEGVPWVVESVATLPSFRGRGLAPKLLDEVLARGHEAGYERSQLTILIGNASAQRVYERFGFRIVEEKRHPEFEAALGCPGLARMIRPLAGSAA